MDSTSPNAELPKNPAGGRRAATLLRLGALLTVGSVFAFHFAATLLYLTPLNPLKADLYEAVHAYMDPFFTQNWSMFAPDPILEDERVIIVSCRLAGAGEDADQPLVDVTSRLQRIQQKYRLTPALRLVRAQLAPLSIMFPRQNVLDEQLLKLTEEKDPVLSAMGDKEKQSLDSSKAEGLRLLERIGAAECERLNPGREIAAVRPLFVFAAAPVFSRRMTNEVGPTKTVDFGWLSAERVEPM